MKAQTKFRPLASLDTSAGVFIEGICHKYQNHMYSKTCVKQPLSKKQKIGFQDKLLLNTGQMYCRMLQGEHSAILSTFIKLPWFVIKIFVFAFFEWPFYCTIQFLLHQHGWKTLLFSLDGCIHLFTWTIRLNENSVDCDQMVFFRARWYIDT